MDNFWQIQLTSLAAMLNFRVLIKIFLSGMFFKLVNQTLWLSLQTLDTLRLSVREDCNIISLWALGGASIAHCLLSLNSSINFFIYAFTSSTFREVLRAKVVKITPEPILTWIQSVNCQRSSPELLEVEMKAEEVKMVVQKETLPVCTPPPAPAPLLELHHIEDEIDVTTITTKLD